MPRKREPPALRVRWSKRERDLLFLWDKYPPDGHLLYGAFCVGTDGERSFAKELEARGYDLTTLRFQIRRKDP